MRAGGEKDALLRGRQRAPPQPGRGRVLVERRAAKALVAQQRVEIARDPREAFAVEEVITKEMLIRLFPVVAAVFV